MFFFFFSTPNNQGAAIGISEVEEPLQFVLSFLSERIGPSSDPNCWNPETI